MTETLDRLYLEISQTTRARTERERLAESNARQISQLLEVPTEDNIVYAMKLANRIWVALDPSYMGKEPPKLKHW